MLLCVNQLQPKSVPISQITPINPRPYRGRFAPSPTGPLHFGSLVAALGSYLDARSHDGVWLLRIEDLDPPRVHPGSADAILRSLDAHGFAWDAAVVRQSQRHAAYADALVTLQHAGLVYACTCSRKALGARIQRGVDGPVYPGHCRTRNITTPRSAQRLRVPDQRLAFDDRLQGQVLCTIAHELGDFVIRRADGVYSYQLAVVVDDAAQGITDVVRGSDLLASTPRQIILQTALGLPKPRYLHLPIVLDAAGDKLSKQTLATPLDDTKPLPTLLAALRFLGHAEANPPTTLTEFWPWAIALWSSARLPRWRGSLLNP